MNTIKKIAIYLGIALTGLIPVNQAAFAGVAGYAQFVNGSVRIVSAAGQTRTLQKGVAVNEGDTVISAKGASAQIRMQDGGFVAMRPDTQLKFDSFKFSGKEDGSERSFFSLFKGGFRAVTGLIGRVNKPNYRITTAVATIGIRGTDHETYVVSPDNSLANGVPIGTYNKVNVGETFMTTDKGTIFVLPNQMGFAGAADQMPELKPLNTDIFTVADKPAKEARSDKEEGNEDGKEVRETATVDNTAEQGAAPAAEVASSTGEGKETHILQPITTTNGADLSGGGEQFAALAAASAADAANAAAAANTAAQTAATAGTQLTAIALVVTAPATTAIGTANSMIATASSLVTSATALTPVSATTASGNATSAQTAAATSASQAAAAQAAFTANGTFADSLAAPANSLATSANTSVQSANTSVQSAAGSVAAQNLALAAAQSAASTALASANTNLTAANNSLNTANTNNTAIATAQSAVTGLVTQAQTAMSAAQAAATAAQSAATQAATLQAAGDFTGAAAQLTIAQQQLTIAQQQQAIAQNASTTLTSQVAAATTAQTNAGNAVTAAVSSANSAATNAGTGTAGAQTYAANAQTAATTASSALATTTSQLAVVTSNAATVATNAPIAAYNNPAVASNNFTGHLAMPVPVTGGYNIANEQNNSQQANTLFVLDGSGNLVEMRNTSFQIQPMQSTPATSIANADVMWSGGTAADTFKLADNSIYAGRWSGATVTVTDLATTPLAPFSLTPANSLWAVLLTPTPGYVQSLVGTTNYNMAGATTPFDAAGNLGTLNTATLSADFTNQLVNATLNLTMPSGVMAGTYAVTANNMPINTVVSGDSSGFGGNTIPSVNCSGTCAAGAGGYSTNVGGSFAGTAAASAGLGYDIWPTVSAGLPASDLVQGLVAFTTAPAVGTFAAYTPSNVLIETAVPFFSMGWGSPMAAPADITYTPTGSNNLSSFIDREIVGGGSFSYSVTDGTAPVTGVATSAATGIQFGRWTSVTALEFTLTAQVGGQNWGVPTTWMYGPEGYLDAGITAAPSGQMYGTFTYALDGSTAPYDKQYGQSGTLTGASVSVDFITSLVDADVALIVGGQTWLASATGMSLNGSQFFADAGGGGLSVSVGVGTPVACPTCFGSLNGVFTGQNYAGAILSYNLGDSSANAGGDVSGQAALVRTGPTITNGTVAPTGMYVVADFGGSIQTAETLSTDGSGVLTAYSWGSAAAPGSGYMSTTVTCTTCTVAAPTANTPATGIYSGTWDAGSFTSTYGFSIGSASPHWITGPEAGPLFLANALVGTKTFSFDGGMVTNFNGVAGTVLGTTALTVDFTRQVVDINLDLSVPGILSGSHTWNAQTLDGNEAIINGGRGIGGAAFQASSYNITGPGFLTVTVDGTTSGNGNVSGQLTGTGLNGAILSYDLSALLPSFSFEQVNGVAALASTTSDAATPHRQVLMSMTDPNVAVIPAVPVLGFYENAPARMVTDGAGNLTQFDMNTINNSGDNNPSMTLTSNTSVPVDAGNDAATGISWGRWEGGSVNATDRNNTVTTPHTLAGSLHWIAGPTETAAVTLPVSGTYTYTNAGGTAPTDNLGAAGTLNSATLSADFTAQTVNVGVNVTVAGATMDAAAANVPIIQRTAFYADSQMPGAAHLAVTCTGSCGTSAQGVIAGGFSGAGATGAMMTYGLQNVGTASTQVISGVTAFHR